MVQATSELVRGAARPELLECQHQLLPSLSCEVEARFSCMIGVAEVESLDIIQDDLPGVPK